MSIHTVYFQNMGNIRHCTTVLNDCLLPWSLPPNEVLTVDALTWIMTGVWHVQQGQTNNDEASDYGIEHEDVQSSLDSVPRATVEIEISQTSLLEE